MVAGANVFTFTATDLTGTTQSATVTVNVSAFVYLNGTTLTRTYSVNPSSRHTVAVNSAVPELVNEEFAAVITSTTPIAVERALYWNAGGVTWAAGRNAPAIRVP